MRPIPAEHDPAVCPHEVKVPVMRHRWERLTFLHWRFDPVVVQRLLPAGLRIETFDGSAWVGLVPFYIEVSLPHTPSIPWASRFCETNVRTYVHDGAGRSGIWFFSLDAERLAAVIAARGTYQLPYFWSQMRLTEQGDRIEYDAVRRWPGRTARSRVVISRGKPMERRSLTMLDHFLTARWNVFSVWPGNRYMFARASHPPWPLHQADVLELDDELVAAAGLPAPHTEPLVHYSPGVDVQVGPPQPTRPARRLVTWLVRTPSAPP